MGGATERSSPKAVRLAATLILARDGTSGVEVLMLRRASGSRFAPGYVVFPGGSVEPGDAELGQRWFGDAAEEVRACAVRELAEETGLAVTGGGVRELDPDVDVIDVVSADPPRLDSIPQIGRWIAPEFLEERFDAGFFVAAAVNGLQARPDGVEIEEAWWARPRDVLDRSPLWRALLWPTYHTLEKLTLCGRVSDVLRLQLPQEAPRKELVDLFPTDRPPAGFPRLRFERGREDGAAEP